MPSHRKGAALSAHQARHRLLTHERLCGRAGYSARPPRAPRRPRWCRACDRDLATPRGPPPAGKGSAASPPGLPAVRQRLGCPQACRARLWRFRGAAVIGLGEAAPALPAAPCPHRWKVSCFPAIAVAAAALPGRARLRHLHA